jgi:V8-like Glu-specific endopeptidase
MSDFLISTLKESLEDRIESGVDASDLIDFLRDVLKPNIKSTYYQQITQVIGAYKRSEQSYFTGSLTEESFSVASSKFIRSLINRLNNFQKLDSLGVLRASEHTIVPASSAMLVDREKVIGKRNFLKIEWLKRGDEVSKHICKIRLHDDSTGTGFYLKGGYIMTNRHVLPSEDAAANAELIFNYTAQNRTETLLRKLDLESEFFIGAINENDLSCDFDFAVFKIKGDLDLEGLEFSMDLPDPFAGDLITVIQHPWGRPMELSVDLLTSVDHHMINYKADTNSGSSGAPVFDKKWRLIGIHFGSLANESHNTGLRASRIIGHLPQTLQSSLGYKP